MATQPSGILDFPSGIIFIEGIVITIMKINLNTIFKFIFITLEL